MQNKVFDRLCDDVANIYLFFLVAYIVTGILSRSYAPLRTLIFWPAFHVCMVLLGLLTLLSIRRRGLRLFIAHQLAQVRRVRPLAALKIAAIAGLVIWALMVGADLVAIALLVFGGAAVLFRTIDERLPAAIAATMLVSIPLLQLMDEQRAASWMAVYAFEALTIVVLSAVARVLQEPKMTLIHRTEE
jgi:hypothetical protein